MTYIDTLNRRLGEALGTVCGGTLPRFCWRHAPSEHYFVYDRDNRNVLKKRWADTIGPDAKPLGNSWVLAEWKVTKATDHMGFRSDIRMAVVRSAGYAPHLETAMARGVLPSEELNANYIWALRQQLDASAEQCGDGSFNNYLAEEKYTEMANNRRDRAAWLETAREGFDDNTGAMGNCVPGTAGGFLSFGGV